MDIAKSHLYTLLLLSIIISVIISKCHCDQHTNIPDEDGDDHHHKLHIISRNAKSDDEDDDHHDHSKLHVVSRNNDHSKLHVVSRNQNDHSKLHVVSRNHDHSKLHVVSRKNNDHSKLHVVSRNHDHSKLHVISRKADHSKIHVVSRKPKFEKGHLPKLHAVSRSKKGFSIESAFQFPAPLPSWPPGNGFATGTIDFGGLVIAEVTTFEKVWATYDGGPDDQGATFFEPVGLPEGYFLLGYYSQPNNRPLFGSVLVGKDTSNPANPALKWPVDFALVWSSKSLQVKEDSNGYIWAPIPSDGYQAVGLVVTTTPDKPPLETVRCVRNDFTTLCEPDEWVWGREGGVDSDEFNIFESRPVRKGKQASAVGAGTFLAKSGGGTTADTPLLVCLKYVKKNTTYMPNLQQLAALIEAYAPKIYMHPKEQFLPSSVEWFFQNGALLYKKGDESNPVSIDPSGSNLPQGGSNDGEYWIDYPRDKGERNRVKKGDLGSACAYYHIKPMLAGTYTDLAIWVYYPFNGPSSGKVGFLSIPLGKIGEHVSDWEHVTLRISNFNGMLRSVYFSQHAGGQWVYPSDLEYTDGNRIVGYSSLHGHACYPKAGEVVQGNNYVGVRNDTAKSDKVLDTGKNFKIISADYLDVPEPPWLNYARKWGPKIAYNINDEIHKVARLLPGKLQEKFLNFTKSVPPELLGEQGPTGPKMKRSWDGEEANIY